MRHFTVLLLTLTTLTGCAAPSRSAFRAGEITHVVVCHLKQPGDAAARQRVIDESYKLRDIPGVLDVSAGPAVPSTRPAVDSTFDVAVVIRFRDERALRGYDGHPLHVRAVQDVLRPLAGKVVIYDIRHAPPASSASSQPEK